MTKPNGLMEAGAPPMAGGIEAFMKPLPTQPLVVTTTPQANDSLAEAQEVITTLQRIRAELDALYRRSSRSAKDHVHTVELQCRNSIDTLQRIHGKE